MRGLNPLKERCTQLLPISLFAKWDAADLRKIAVRTSPVVPAANINPYIHHEMVLSLGCGRLVRLGLYETDHCNLRANLSHRQLPQLEGLQISAKNSQEPLLARDRVPRDGCPEMEVVRDYTIQSRWILFLNSLKPLGLQFREKDLESCVGNDPVSFLLILWRSEQPRGTQQN